ncbi:MAG: hypothetical protein KGL99_14830 [Burkholderiales bacterium]|nr:hypothetical protein [Burkholderiales bacterium]MDE2628425.1 hypothetical protein [Burkholderiales bacterium]
MTRVAHTRATPAPHNAAVWWSAASLVRWLLVLLLVVDQIGSPLHHHRHDAGFDGSSIGAAHQVASGSDFSRVAGDPCEPGVFHAITAIRFEARLAVAAAPDGHHAGLAPACAAPVLADRLVAASEVVWRPEPAAAPHPLYRSLPPDTRAPPRHA